MKSNRLFVFLMTLAVIGLALLPLGVAHAAPTVQEAGPLIDWSAILEKILAVVLPIVAGAITTQAIVAARYTWLKLKAERPDIVELINKAAQFVVPVIEQLKKNGTIPDNETAKREAVKMAKRVLVEWGVEMRLADLYVDLISDAIEGAVNNMNSQKLVMTGELVSSGPPLAG